METTNGWSMEFEITDMNPDLFALLTGQNLDSFSVDDDKLKAHEREQLALGGYVN